MSIFFRRGTTFADYVKDHPFTMIIVLLNFLMLVYTIFTGGFNVQNLNEIGAIYGNIRENGQWWRIITAAFLHGSFEHFMGNIIFGVMFMTAGMETLAGSWKTAVIYFAAVILGGVFVELRTDITTIGASGGIYGILGAFLFFTIYRKNVMTKEDRQMIWIFAALQILSTFFSPFISKEGHIGGLITGFLICYLLFGIHRDSINSKYLNNQKKRVVVESYTYEELYKKFEQDNHDDEERDNLIQ